MSEQGQQQGTENVYAAPDARVEDVTPAGETELAGRGARLAAAIIDGIIMMITGALTAFLFGVNLFSPTSPPSTMMATVIGVINIVWYLVINGKLLAANGQSVGKKVMNIKIVRTDGSKADLQRIIGLRLAPIWVVSMIPYVGSVAAIIDCLLIFRSSRKCLHDDIADTIVIKV